MNKIIKIFIGKLRTLARQGLLDILVSNFINKIIAFLANILVVRFLSKSQYGVYSYSYSIINFFLLLNGMGLISAVLQYGSESRDEQSKFQIYRFALFRGFRFDLILAITAFIFSFIFSFKMAGAENIFRALIFLPAVIYLQEFLLTILRCEGDNRKYAISININSLFLLLFPALGAWMGGLVLYVVGLYAAYLFSLVPAILFFNREYLKKIFISPLLEKPLRTEVLHYAWISCGTNSTSQIMLVASSFLVGQMLTNPDIMASYKVASNIPNNLYFLPQSIIIFIYPYFAQNNRNIEWLQKKTKSFFWANGLTNLLAGGALLILARPIILVLYGDAYGDAVFIMQILTLSFIVGACFRTPAGNVLAAMRRIKSNLVITTITSIGHLLLLPLMITRWGSEGAAYTTLLSTTLGAVLAMGMLIYSLYIKQEGAVE